VRADVTGCGSPVVAEPDAEALDDLATHGLAAPDLGGPASLAAGDSGVPAATGNPADQPEDGEGSGPALFGLAVAGLGLAVVAVAIWRLGPSPRPPARGFDTLTDPWRLGPW